MEKELKELIANSSEIQTIPKGTEILREGQYVKVLPVVLSGVIKVYSSFDSRELLLYYIEPAESCIMSFSAAIFNFPSKVYAMVEEEAQVLLMPVDSLSEWTRYTSFNQLIYTLFNQRYSDMLQTINGLIFDNLDDRIFAYLKERARVTGSNTINVTNTKIAQEIASAREVVSRVMKKLERQGRIEQTSNGILLKA